MQIDEKLILVLGAIALVALIIFKRDAPIEEPVSTVVDLGASLVPSASNMVKGPAYLVANRPYAFLPPINNFLPTITMGQEAQVVEGPAQFIKRQVASAIGGS